MRRTRMLCRLAVAGAATLLPLAACSSGSPTNTASSTTSAAATSTSAATTTTTSSAPAGGAFCGQAQGFVSQVQAIVTAQANHQTDLGQKLPALVSELRSVTPPATIANDWQTALSALEQLGQAFQGVNLSDPQQLQQLEQKVQPLETQLGAAGQHIQDYLKNQCGIDVNSSSSATG